MISLSNFTQLLLPANSSPPLLWETPAGPAVLLQFCNSASAHMACSRAFDVIRAFGSQARAGWQPILHCLLRLYELQVLPSSIVDDGTLLLTAEEWGVFVAQADAGAEHTKDTSRQNDAAKSSEQVSFFGRMFGSQAPEDERFVEEHGPEFEGTLVAKRSQVARFLSSGPVSTFIQDTHEHDDLALRHFAHTLINEICPRDRTSSPDPSSTGADKARCQLLGVEPWAMVAGGGWPQLPLPPTTASASVWCEELLLGIAVENRARAAVLWPQLRAHFEAVLIGATHASQLVGKVVTGIFRLCISYWAVSKLQGPLLATLTLLLKLEPNVWEPIAPMAASGAKRVVREIGGAPALCQLMVQLLERCAECRAADQYTSQCLRHIVQRNSSMGNLKIAAGCSTVLTSLVMHQDHTRSDIASHALALVCAQHTALGKQVHQHGIDQSFKCWTASIQRIISCCQHPQFGGQAQVLLADIFLRNLSALVASPDFHTLWIQVTKSDVLSTPLIYCSHRVPVCRF